MNVAAPPIHIFRAGTYTASSGQPVTLTAADLSASALAYDPAHHEAPLTVGHPKDNAPAFGWVARLSAQGDDLEAVPRDVPAEFATAVRERRFAKISASFWPPSHPENPAPGVWSLRHVAFLGAAVPAVLGLRPVSLAGADDCITIEFAAPAATTEHDMADQDPAARQTADFAAREQALNARETTLKTQEDAIAAREQALREAEQVARRAEIASFVSGLTEQGRVLPVDQRALVSLLMDVGGESSADFAAPLADGDAVPRTPGAWLREFLGRLPKQVEYAELSSGSLGAPSREQINEAEIDASARRMAGLPPETK